VPELVVGEAIVVQLGLIVSVSPLPSPVAALLIVIVVAPTPVIVADAGMLVPEIRSPIFNPATEETPTVVDKLIQIGLKQVGSIPCKFPSALSIVAI